MTLRMTIAENGNTDVLVVDLAGRIDASSIEELSEGFEQVKRTGKRNIALMMRDIAVVNSRGVAALLSFVNWGNEEGRSVVLAEVPESLRRLLMLVGIEKLASVYETLAEAVESLEQNSARQIPEDDEGVKRRSPRQGGLIPRRMPGIGLGFAAAVVLVVLVFGVVFFLREEDQKTPGVDLGPLVEKITPKTQRLPYPLLEVAVAASY